ADLVRFGLLASCHADQIARFMGIVVKDREIVAFGAEARTHQKRGFGIIGGNLAGRAFDTENLAQKKGRAIFGIFTHYALIVGIGDVFGKFIGDVAAFLGRIQRLVDT